MKSRISNETKHTEDAPRDRESAEPSGKRAYSKPSVEPAGSVFSRTGALGSGTKDGLSGSTLL